MIIQTMIGSEAGGGSTDPYHSQVVLLMHMDGTDASTTFIDEVGATVTAVGSAQIDTAQSKWGGASGLFADTSSDWATVPNVGRYAIGSSNFTLEAWVRYASTSAGTRGIIGQRDGAFSDAAFNWYTTDGSLAHLSLAWDAGGSNDYSVGMSYTYNVWYHLAVCKAGASLYFFKDGVQQGSTVSLPANNTIRTVTSSPVAIGNGARATSVGFGGWIDDLRWTIGTARYTSNFTPPTGPFPNP
jgi:hypothetical protein